MKLVGIAMRKVIESHYVDGNGDSFTPVAATGDGYAPGWVELLSEHLHLCGDPFALDIAFNTPFFIADRPKHDTRMVAVAADQSFELPELCRRTYPSPGSRQQRAFLTGRRHRATRVSAGCAQR